VAHVTEADTHVWTAADLLERFGPIPLRRVRLDPEPGTATEEDLLFACEREKRYCELIDGTLVEKIVGFYESCLAMAIGDWLRAHVKKNRLGVVAGEGGLVRVKSRRVRIPDVCFVSRDRLPNEGIKGIRILEGAPDLAIEVISPDNTREEMEEKLREYFDGGARQVWYFYPVPEEVRVYHSADRFDVYRKGDAVPGGDVLPGFSLPVREVFEEAREYTKRTER
jgi:Uma2 family endonuclease